MKIKTKLLITTAIPVAVLVILCTVFGLTIGKMNRTSNMVVHTYNVISHAKELVAAMVDQETGLRGFAVAGQEDFLEPYLGGKKTFSEKATAVKKLVDDNPEQVVRFEEVEASAVQWQEYAQKMIDLRKEVVHGEEIREQLEALVKSGVGKKNMDELRSLLAQTQKRSSGLSRYTDQVILDMVNMETGLRGFLFNNNEDYLEPYFTGKKNITKSILKLSQQGTAVKQIETAVSNWIESYAEKAIALNRENMKIADMKIMYSEFAKKQGKTHMDEMRKAIAIIISVEDELMGKRVKESERAVAIAWATITTGAVVTAVMAIFSILFILRGIIAPLNIFITTLIAMLKDISEGEGDLTKRVVLKTKDELSEMAGYLNSFIGTLHTIIGNIKDSIVTLSISSDDMLEVSTQLSSGAEEMVAQSATVSSSTEEMSANITTMASASEEMSATANEVAGAAEQTSQNMNAVSSAVEEMSVSINQIANDAGTARDVADQANQSSLKATSTMGTLSEAAKDIGNVTEVIKRIAEQTNLLALNATIEAASAGEAGKGFAVVANEIKELANQSAQAADDIAERITGVQNNTKQAVTVISDVSDIIGNIRTTVTNIAQSVEQQNEAVNDISANITQASTGTHKIAGAIAEVAKGASDVSRNSGEASCGANEVTRNITGIQRAVEDTNSGAGKVNSSAQALAKVSTDLEELVSRFKL